MEKKKLATQIEELQAQVAAQSKQLAEREDSLQKLQVNLDFLFAVYDCPFSELILLNWRA